MHAQDKTTSTTLRILRFFFLLEIVHRPTERFYYYYYYYLRAMCSSTLPYSQPIMFSLKVGKLHQPHRISTRVLFTSSWFFHFEFLKMHKIRCNYMQNMKCCFCDAVSEAGIRSHFTHNGHNNCN